MESNKTSKILKIAAIVVLTIAVLAPSYYWCKKAYQKAKLKSSIPVIPISRFIKSDLPLLNLDIHFKDINGKEIYPKQSKLTDGLADKSKTVAIISEKCPKLIGGDTKEVSRIQGDDKTPPENCPKAADWYVKRHPISFSIYFQDAKEWISLFNEDIQVKNIYESKFIRGIFYEFFHSLSIRGEDLKLEGLKGAFLKKLFIEALEADGELHYDIAHGKNGFVFSFVEAKSPFASKVLPIMVRFLARSGYKVSKLAEPILEIKIGLMRFFITQYENHIFIANGLESLLNTIECLNTSEDMLKMPLVAVLRGHAFLERILQVVSGEPEWEARLGLDLSIKNKNSGNEILKDPGVLEFTSGKFVKHLQPKIFKGVFASIPHDVFGAVVTSFYLPSEMMIKDWQSLTTKGPGDEESGPDEAGVAILWDIDAKTSTISEIGVVIANPKAPEKSNNYKQYFKNKELTSEGAGATLFMAATSQNLLNRMRESCEKQSFSILDWERGTKFSEYESAQVFMFINPGLGMRELFMAGGAASGNFEGFEFEPQWKQDYEKAKELMRKDSENVFKNIPILSYAGTVKKSSKTASLKGFTIKQINLVDHTGESK